MNVMIENNFDTITEKIIPIELVALGSFSEHLIPAPITPVTIQVSKDATEVDIPVGLYLEAGFPASSISYCMEAIIADGTASGKLKETRVVSISYDFDVKKESLYKPHVYNVKLFNLDVAMEEMEVTFFLTNLDPETSRGTTTTIKREM
ncbi:hypothetical protein KORDIASMS9_00641 [Kordia sp. SMS9]|uniref:hypothetical protein n=1 Tax=Kordia sp. SMS9 TaxID=2282170 RepID=UPI000E0D7E82|nr:hypothetical protein [Kordia sp. SMS9]AXG68426.1 hypothetical protein KORDIASMS9_00641 [Kordia sp. SMS9]